MTVSGADSTWTNNGSLYVGYNGSATLNISNGGSVSVADAIYDAYGSGSSGVIVFDNGTLTTKSLWASPNTMTGTGTLNTRGLISDFDLLFDSTQSLKQSFPVHMRPNQNITMSLDLSNASNNGDFGAGFNGNASLTIQNGIALNTQAGYLGYSSGSRGTATINGAGSKWTNTAELDIGRNGDGSMKISNGGLVSNTYGYIGYSAGSTGSVTVDGTGSKWTSSDLYVGRYGNGALNVTNGGTVSSYGYGCYVGAFPGVSGDIKVNGANSKLTCSQTIYVGRGGNGTMEIDNGGSVIAYDYGYIGSGSGAKGVVTVRGTGSARNEFQ